MYGPLTHGTINQRLFYGAAIVVLIMMLMPQTAHAAGSVSYTHLTLPTIYSV